MLSNCAFVDLLKDGTIDLFSVEYDKEFGDLKVNFYFKKKEQSAPHKISYMLSGELLNDLNHCNFIENRIKDIVANSISKYEVE